MVWSRLAHAAGTSKAHENTCLAPEAVGAAWAQQRAGKCGFLHRIPCVSSCAFQRGAERASVSGEGWRHVEWGLIQIGQNLFKRALACLRFAVYPRINISSLCCSW